MCVNGPVSAYIFDDINDSIVFDILAEENIPIFADLKEKHSNEDNIIL